MDLDDEEIPAQVDVVDPALRAHIYSLATALGGSSSSATGVYDLGDDALACLKDLKRWLQGYDEKLNRLDVARCLAEANLVAGDLLPILANLASFNMDDPSKLRLALACVELLVPLTWPLEKSDAAMTRNHHRHMAYLQHSQLRYKAAILHHKSQAILDACIRVVLPSMAIPKSDRGARDEAIIRLVLFLTRNIAMLEHGDVDPSGIIEDVSRSATVIAFERENVFRLLLTIASGLGKGFDVQDVIVLEVLFYLLRGLDPKEIFMTQPEQIAKSKNELQAALLAEQGLKKTNAKTAPTRHNRFGTTIWMDKGGGNKAVVTGQAPLLSTEKSLQKIDSTKTWNRPKPRQKIDATYKELNRYASLTSDAQKSLRGFVEEFLDSSFNPFFDSLRRAMERDSDRLQSDMHPRQYCYLMSWFLQAHRERAAADRLAAKKSNSIETNHSDFSLIAAVLNQETTILLTKYMNESLELKAWGDTQAGCLCLTQILLTVQDMAASPKEDDQDDAENIQNRLFYEEATQEMVARIVRNYERQPLKYLDAITELGFVHIRMLEKYSKRNSTMITKMKRQKQKKNKTTTKDGGGGDGAGGSDDENMETESRRTVAERTFNFNNFEAKYLSQTSVNTFVSLLSFYRELNYNQIKRAIHFLHRIFVKREMEMLLYRMDIVELMNRIVQDNTALPSSHKAYTEVHQFVKHFTKRLTAKLKERPSLIVELLFSKIPRTVHYLQTGQEVQQGPKNPKKAAELEVKPGYSHKDQVSIVVSNLIEDEGNRDLMTWLKSILLDAINERKAWEAANAAELAISEATAAAEKAAKAAAEGVDAVEADEVAEKQEAPKPDYPIIRLNPNTEEQKKALASDQKIILLFKLLGCKKTEDEPNATEQAWMIPPETTTQKLEEALEHLQNAIANPMTMEDDTNLADLLRKKRKPRERQIYASSDEEEFIFPDNLRNPSTKADKPKKGKKRRHRGDNEDHVELSDSELERRAEKRRKKNAEKRSMIKSELYVRESDDEEDVELDTAFWEREKQLQKDMSKAMEQATINDDEEDGDVVPKKKKKRITYVDESDDGGGEEEGESAKKDKSKKNRENEEDDEEEEEQEEEDRDEDAMSKDDDEEESIKKPSSTKRRKRAAFVESEDEDDD